MADYRPISLSNVVSRIVSKVLANRVKPLLPNIISDSQSAFVPGRLISDNTSVAYEMLHRMRNRRKGKTGHMAVKLDISKAYDRVEWEFLRKIMVKLGLAEKWVNLAMQCVSSATYTVLLNGEPRGFISPARGIRQGDPLSPYLFLFCVEGLSALIRRATDSQQLQGLRSCRGGVSISHLLFADDSLLFCPATPTDCNRLIQILSTYEQASGQAINRQKTALFFSPNTNVTVRERIRSMLNARIVSEFEKYLGLPMVGGKNKMSTFKDLREKIAKRVTGWKEKFISKAGREVLIKTVACIRLWPSAHHDRHHRHGALVRIHHPPDLWRRRCEPGFRQVH